MSCSCRLNGVMLFLILLRIMSADYEQSLPVFTRNGSYISSYRQNELFLLTKLTEERLIIFTW